MGGPIGAVLTVEIVLKEIVDDGDTEVVLFAVTGPLGIVLELEDGLVTAKPVETPEAGGAL